MTPVPQFFGTCSFRQTQSSKDSSRALSPSLLLKLHVISSLLAAIDWWVAERAHFNRSKPIPEVEQMALVQQSDPSLAFCIYGFLSEMRHPQVDCCSLTVDVPNTSIEITTNLDLVLINPMFNIDSQGFKICTSAARCCSSSGLNSAFVSTSTTFVKPVIYFKLMCPIGTLTVAK